LSGLRKKGMIRLIRYLSQLSLYLSNKSFCYHSGKYGWSLPPKWCFLLCLTLLLVYQDWIFNLGKCIATTKPTNKVLNMYQLLIFKLILNKKNLLCWIKKSNKGWVRKTCLLEFPQRKCQAFLPLFFFC